MYEDRVLIEPLLGVVEWTGTLIGREMKAKRNMQWEYVEEPEDAEVMEDDD